MPVQRGESVRVHGLKELQRAIRRTNLEQDLKAGHRAVSTDIVAAARARATGQGSVAAKSAQAITAGATARAATINLGSNKYPFALGAEFGAVRFKQFKPWRGSGEGAGYFLYPTIRERRAETIREYEKLIDRILRPIAPD